MKLFWKILGYGLLTLLLLAYGAFIFVLPRVVDLNNYKELVQQLAKEQAHLNVDFSNVELMTTPALEAGVILKDLKVTLPDNSELLSADRIKAKVSLPNIFLLTVRVSEVALDNPKVNVEIAQDGSQYKIMQVVEDLINEQKQKQEVTPPKAETVQFNPNWIHIKVPNVKVANYSVLINDLKSGHRLELKGDDLRVGYFDNKKIKIKTVAQLLSDDNVNINANIDVDSFIPPAAPVDEDDDPDYRVVLGFVNPVLTYRDYDLKTDVNAKVKARLSRRGKLTVNGFADVENLTMNLSGYQLPKSFLKTRFKGQNVFVNTDLYVTKNQNIMATGLINFSKHPKADLCINTTKIYFRDVLRLSKAFMDTMGIKNDLAQVKANGFFAANMQFKTDLKKLTGNGGFVVRKGSLVNNMLGLSHINANVIFNDKKLEILDTYLNVNDSILKLEGTIDNKNVADISIYTDKLPLAPLFKAFAPVDLKRAYDMKSGALMLNTKIAGKLKKLTGDVDLAVSNLDFGTKDNSLNIKNENLAVKLHSDMKTLTGKINNKNLTTYIAPTKSSVKNPDLEISIEDGNIMINPLKVIVNKVTQINVEGSVLNYAKKPALNIKVNGGLNALDMKQLLGDMAAPFVEAKGTMPFRLVVDGNAKRQNLRLQVKTDAKNYLTPIHIDMLQGKNNILQTVIHFKGDRLNIRNTGLYTADTANFGEDFDLNLDGAVQVSKVSGTISKLNTSDPYINQITVTLPKEVRAKLHAFKNSELRYGGDILLFGYSSAPKFKGEFRFWDVSIPELYLKLKNLDLKFIARTLDVTIEDLLLNGSDIQVKTKASLAPSPVFTINNLLVQSSNFDLEKVMKVVDASMKYVPQTTTSQQAKNSAPADLPIVISEGKIDFRRISAPPILLTNTTSDISLFRNIFYLNNIMTSTIGGRVNGNVSVNLVTMLLKAKLRGENFDTERALLELMNMKDTISGIASFDTDIEINAGTTDYAEQMKSLGGTIDFQIEKGQLGPFGHLENMILSENIRNSEFFQTALGGVIDSLTSIQTSHFDVMNGHIVMKDGVATLDPITSLGPVMCLHIAGDMNLLNNQADMILRARLGSKIADMLGPIAAVNPINLVKATPGLNVAAAKMFSIFCEQITPEEMNAIPRFEDKFNDLSATNFQIVLEGDTQKPLTLFKSFKWLATSDEINAANDFVNTLPPADAENPNATLEELLEKQAEEERIANENVFQKAVRKTKEFFSRFKKEGKK